MSLCVHVWGVLDSNSIDAVATEINSLLLITVEDTRQRVIVPRS